MHTRHILIPILALALSGCGDSSFAPPRKVVSAPPPPVQRLRPPAPTIRQATPFRPAPAAKAPVLPGLEAVIGATTADLSRQFGPPRLDVWEGDARKLQFVGTACVLDVYLYPSAPGRDPQASHVEARRASDARDVDRAACVAALRKR